MKKPILTKYCSYDKDDVSTTNLFEKKFEAYIEKKVKKIINKPQNYPFIKIIDGEGKIYGKTD
ncbi:hypothetical protein [Streptococcus cuniculipharyngis]|uniref:Uncharacterized protein n=1 Tax=Streptococcus cuniculipharyngis TaxID=1562651 RepID=A0A5C5SG46_9STRE|nr:hypothetical protein [Streptococcus cuniculipharyngis]TWS99240.1 hypothetical protein FRX57_03315 [Streptococcus cuniculipharyngis]